MLIRGVAVGVAIVALLGCSTHRRGLAFYLDRASIIPEFETPQSLADAVRRGAIRWVVARRRDLDSLGVTRVVAEEPIFPWESADQTEYKLMLLAVEP